MCKWLLPKEHWEPVYWLQNLLLHLFLQAHAALTAKSRSLPCSPPCHQSHRQRHNFLSRHLFPPPPFGACDKYFPPNIICFFLLQNKQTQVDRLFGFLYKSHIRSSSSVFEPTLHLHFWKTVMLCFTRAGKVDMIKIMWGFHVNWDCICVSVVQIHSSCMHSHKIRLFVFSCGFGGYTHNSTHCAHWQTDLQSAETGCSLLVKVYMLPPLSPDQLQPNNTVMLQSGTPDILKAWNCTALLTHFGVYKQPHPSLWNTFFWPDRHQGNKHSHNVNKSDHIPRIKKEWVLHKQSHINYIT